MFLDCIRKELLSNILSLRYGLTFFLFLVLTLAPTVVRTEMHKHQDADYARAQSLCAEAIDSTENWWEINNLGVTVGKRPNPLAIFAGGLETDMTRSNHLGSEEEPTVSPREMNIPALRYGIRLDMVAVINIACSLLALLLLFDAVCGEREEGTLKMMLAGPLPRDIVILSKLAAGAITLLTPLALVWIVNVLYVTVIAGVTLPPQSLERLAWLSALSGCYVAFFSALGIAVSSWVQRSATALVTCLFIWAVLVLAMPNLLPMVINRAAPIPTESKIIQEKNAIEGDLQRESPKWREEAGATGSLTTLQQIDSVVNARFREEYSRRAKQLDRFYQECVNRQLRLNQQLARLSPSATFVYASTHTAGTGMQDFLHLLSDLEQHRTRIDEFLKTKREEADKVQREFQQRSERGEQGLEPPTQERPSASLIPVFAYQPLTVALTLNSCWIDVVILAGGCVLLFLAAYVGFMRYAC